MDKNRKKVKPNQNLFDYILTNYGDLSYLYKYLIENDYNYVSDFESLPINKIENIDDDISNYVLSYFKDNQIIVSTSTSEDIEVLSDYNYDFSSDFLS